MIVPPKMGTIHRSSDCNEKNMEKVLSITKYLSDLSLYAAAASDGMLKICDLSGGKAAFI